MTAMSGAVSDVIAFLKRARKRPLAAALNASGRAGPRRLAMLGAAAIGLLVVVVVIVLSGREVPRDSRDARLKAIDPLPGGLHSTPEQDALALAATDEQARRALDRGVSYTPAMAPSQPAQPLPPPAALAPPPQAAKAVARPAGLAPRVAGPVVAPVVAQGFPPPARPAMIEITTEPQLRPTTVAATAPDPQAQQQSYANQINGIFSQWGGRMPRTDVVMPVTRPDGDDPDGSARASAPGTNTRTRDAGSAIPAARNGEDPGRVLVPAGRGVYAHPVLALNSDETSPAVFQADSGPLAGDRMVGSFAKQANRLVIHISSIIHQGEQISCDGVVIAPDTMEAALASGVDEHYVARFLLPAAAAFIAGLGQAIEQTSNSVAVLSPFGGATTTNHLNIQQQLGVAAGVASAQVGSIINQEAPKGPTITLEPNVAVGIMFLSNVVDRRS
jgi:intracellular multiplication protein IcmE